MTKGELLDDDVGPDARWNRASGRDSHCVDPARHRAGVTTRKWRICPTFKNVSGTQVGLTVVVVAFSALRAS
jgi:hypothetical protein